MPRNVLFAAWAPFFSGAERALLMTLKGLDRSRYQPFVIIGTDGELAEQLRAADIPFEIAELQNSDKRHPLKWLRSVYRIATISRQRRAALLHANDVLSFQPCGYAAKVIGIPSICHVRFVDRPAGLQWYLKPGFTRAIFVSEYLRRWTEEGAPGIFAHRSEAIHDPVQMPRILGTDERRQLLTELQLQDARQIVAFIGQIAEVKGIWDFVEMSRLLVARGSAATFVVVGDDLRGGGRLRHEMAQRVRELRLSERFRFAGFRRDASVLSSLFDLVVVPSHVEPLGLVPLEAMAVGRPVVASRVGGIPEIVMDAQTGLLVEPRRPEQLAAAVTHVLSDCALAHTMGAAGRERAQRLFGIERHIARVQAVYDQILDERSGT